MRSDWGEKVNYPITFRVRAAGGAPLVVWAWRDRVESATAVHRRLLPVDLVQHEVRDRLPQLAVSFVMGVVALACFGLVLALLTGQLRTVIAKVRTRLRA
jgi:hypothetical protein